MGQAPGRIWTWAQHTHPCPALLGPAHPGFLQLLSNAALSMPAQHRRLLSPNFWFVGPSSRRSHDVIGKSPSSDITANIPVPG